MGNKMKPKFRVGDRVRCTINSGNSGTVENKEYKILKIVNSDIYPYKITKEQACDERAGVNSTEIELISKGTKNMTKKAKWKVGDLVINNNNDQKSRPI